MSNSPLSPTQQETAGYNPNIETLFQVTFDQAAVGMAHGNINGEFLRVNRKYCDIVGYPVDELMGMTFADLTHPGDIEAGMAQYEQMLAGGIDQFSMEKRTIRKDGSIIWVKLSVSAVWTDDETFDFWVAVIEDITLQKEAEIALSRSEKLYADFFENGAVGLHCVGPDGIILRANRTELDLLGYQPEEYIGQHIAQFHVDQAVIESILNRLKNNEVLRNVESQMICKDGTLRDVLIQSSVYMEEGQFSHTRCFTRDITEFKRSQKALQEKALQEKESEARYQSLYQWEKKTRQAIEKLRTPECVDDLLAMLVKEVGQSLETDRTFVIQFKPDRRPEPIAHEYLKSTDLLSILGMIPPWGECPLLSQCEKSRGKVFIADVTAPGYLDDTWRPLFEQLQIVSWSGLPVYYQDQLLFVLVCHTCTPHTWTDQELFYANSLTEQAATAFYRIKAQRMAAEAEAFYREQYMWEKKTREVLQDIRQAVLIPQLFMAAVNSVSTAMNLDRCFIIEFDETDKVLPVRYENRSCESIPSFMGMKPPWDFNPYLEISARNELAYSHDCFNDSNVVANPAWTEFARKYSIQAIIAVPIIFEHQLINVLVLHSATPRHWTEKELFFTQLIANQLSTAFYQARVKDQLERASLMKSRFLSTMSHELRTPLNSIIGYAGLMEKGVGGSLSVKHQQYVTNIQSSGKHLLNLINEILDLSKVEAGKMTLNLEWLHLESVMNEVADMFKEMARQKQIEMRIDIAADLGPVRADEARFRQILINLISNAIKFNSSGGQVDIGINRSQDGRLLVCTVADTGIGIPQAKMSELFSEFFQVDSSGARQHEGSGLGLALTRRLVELHGGAITAKSQEGKGSTFTFTLPTQGPLN